MDYIEEYGLSLISNASGDPDKEPEMWLEGGTIVLNKAAVTTLGNLNPNLEVRAGKQTGAVIFALTAVSKPTNDTITVRAQKNGAMKIPFKKPMKKYNLDLKKTHQIDLVEVKYNQIVFAVIVDMPEKKEKRAARPTASAGPTAPYGPIGAEFGVISETRIEGSDF